MEAIKRESHGAILNTKFKNGVIYKGDVEEYSNWLEDLHCSLQGETFSTDSRKIPHGEGECFEIYSNENDERIYIWVDTETVYSEEGEEIDKVFYFGEIK